jgi:sialate O-acetylesterase
MEHRYKILLSIVSMLCAQSAVTGQAAVKLPAIISDRMVLQQQSNAPIWGTAYPGERVLVKGSWQQQCVTTTADPNGRWQVYVKTPPAGGPYTMSINGKNSIVLKDIWVGEVWLCSGQSNMEMSVKKAANADATIAGANDKHIRLFRVPHIVAEVPQSDCNGKWELCNSQTVANFSAVAYFFGRELRKELRVPVGLIQSSLGSTAAEAWMSRDALKSNPAFAPLLEHWEGVIAAYPQAMLKYQKNLAAWEDTAAKAKAIGKKERSAKPKPPVGPTHRCVPSGLYNGMIAPLIHFCLRGVIWYQGETNAVRAYQYRTLFPALIKSWRSDGGQGDFPFYYVQLANMRDAKPEPSDSEWAELREAQLMTLSLPNTGMAVTIDIGEANNIHPRNKQEVGRRLALWALARIYDRKITYSGPIYKSMKIEGKNIVISFDHLDGGLKASGDGVLRQFAIAGIDKKFVWAQAQIVGDTVVVGSTAVDKPVAVRYAWAMNPAGCNLYNCAGLPASPFRTDDWPGLTVGKDY